MNARWSTYLSSTVALLFTGWVLWLWIQESSVQKQISQQGEQSEAAPVKTTPQPQEMVALILPTPPAPAPASMPKPEPVTVQTFTPEPTPEPEEKKPANSPTPEKPAQIEQVNPKKETNTPEPQPVQPSKPVEPVAHEVTLTEATGGRALLRVLEHGKGPLIEIAWPAESRTRDKLYNRFKACFGMENALMDSTGNLYRAEGPKGQRWEINMDRFSGFLRQASGRLPAAEQTLMSKIRRFHGTLYAPLPVRIFPRSVDASLLGGLKAVIGQDYAQAKRIQARYELKGTTVVITSLLVDDVARDGRIKLAPYRTCRGA